MKVLIELEKEYSVTQSMSRADWLLEQGLVPRTSKEWELTRDGHDSKHITNQWEKLSKQVDHSLPAMIAHCNKEPQRSQIDIPLLEFITASCHTYTKHPDKNPSWANQSASQLNNLAPSKTHCSTSRHTAHNSMQWAWRLHVELCVQMSECRGVNKRKNKCNRTHNPLMYSHIQQ